MNPMRLPRLLAPAAAVAAALAMLPAAPASAGTDTITRVAGGSGSVVLPQPALQVGLQLPEGASVAADGSYLIADKHNNRILRVRPDGQAVLAAGGGSDAYGEGVPATSAHIDYPTDVAVTPDGGFLFVESHRHRVRKVSAGGIVRTVAGSNSRQGTTGDGGPAVDAGIYYPWSVAVMPDGGFVVSQPYAYRVRRVAPDGTIRTILGNGVDSHPDGVPGTQSGTKWPYGLAVQRDGSVLVAEDFGARIRRVRPDGVVVAFAGSGTDMPGDLPSGGQDGRPATEVGLGRLCDIAVAPDDSVVVTQSDCAVGPYESNSRYYVLGRITPDGRYSVFAGDGQGARWDVEGRHRRATSLGRLRGLAFTADGDLLFVENSYYRAFRIDTDLVPPTTDPDPDPQPEPEPEPTPDPEPDPKPGPTPGPGPGTPDPRDGGSDPRNGGNGGNGGVEDRGDTTAGGSQNRGLSIGQHALRTPRGRTVRLKLRSGSVLSVRVELRRGGRRIARFSRRVPAGRSAVAFAAPRRPGRYSVRVSGAGTVRTVRLTVTR